MYARLILFTLELGSGGIARKMADLFARDYSRTGKFKDVTFFGDDSVGEYGAFVLYESKEDALTAEETLYSNLKSALGIPQREQLTYPLYEVYESPYKNDSIKKL